MEEDTSIVIQLVRINIGKQVLLMQKIKKRGIWIIVAIILLLIFIVFAVTRYSDHTLFIPFTGRVLNIDAGELDLVYIHSGNTGEKISYTETGEIQVMTDKLNGFRYILWLPKNPIPSGGWTYRMVFEFKDETSQSYYFGRNWIEVRGLRYFSADKYFDDLSELLDEK